MQSRQVNNTNDSSDWFRLETENDSFQPTIDLLLNVSIFAWYGAVCPWSSFAHNNAIPVHRLVGLGVLVLLLRRLPIVLVLHKKIHQIEAMRQALFVGFFGPIGVSAIFYLYTAREYLREIEADGGKREDVTRTLEAVEVVVWFMTVCSIVVHGLTIPLGKLGFYLPRTVSRAMSSERPSDDEGSPTSIHLREHAASTEHALEAGVRRSRSRGRSEIKRKISAPIKSFRTGGRIMQDTRQTSRNRDEQGQTKSDLESADQVLQPEGESNNSSSYGQERLKPTLPGRRAIRFPD